MRVYREQTLPAVELATRGLPVVRPRLVAGGIEENYAEVKRRLEAERSPGALRRMWRALRAALGRI
jgi:hypothetical protein